MFCSKIELKSRVRGRGIPRDPPALNPLFEWEIGLLSSFKVDNKNLLSAAFDGLWRNRTVKRN